MMSNPVMDIDRPPAQPECPAIPFSLNKSADYQQPDCLKVLYHTHPVFLSAVLIALVESFTQESIAVVMVPVVCLPAG